MGVREGISVGTQPDGRALSVSPRYQIRHKASRNRGALSYFIPVSGPLTEGFIGGLCAMYGLRWVRPLVPVGIGRHLLKVGSLGVNFFSGMRWPGISKLHQ